MTWPSSSKRRSRQKSGKTTSELPVEIRPECGRGLAWYVLQQHDLTGLFLAELFRDADRLHEVSTRERAAALDLASGVIRRRRTIDTLLESQISRPRAKVETDLWRLLQLGTFQVVYSQTPDHAAVDTTVELARSAGFERWAGFVNGVLRNVQRLMSDEFLDAMAADSLPVNNGQFLKLKQAILPDPASELSEYIGRAFSLPRSLARRWSDRFTGKELERIVFHCLTTPVTCLRVNRLKTTAAALQADLEGAGVEVSPGTGTWSLRISRAAGLTSLPGFTSGQWVVQDEAATLASEVLEPFLGQRVLDLCAAPGGKTTHLAEMMKDNGEIVACDVAEHRLRRVEENVARLGLTSVRPTLIDRDGTGIPDGPFDSALVDVPCSNTGVLARRPEARWRFRKDELSELAQLQTRLLMTAFDRVRPGGHVLYSTCSIEPEETSDVVAAVASLTADLTVVREQLLLPGLPGDGAYQALLRRG